MRRYIIGKTTDRDPINHNQYPYYICLNGWNDYTQIAAFCKTENIDSVENWPYIYVKDESITTMFLLKID